MFNKYIACNKYGKTVSTKCAYKSIFKIILCQCYMDFNGYTNSTVLMVVYAV